MKVLNEPFEVGSWIDVVEFTGFNEREQNGCGLCPSPGMGSVPGFSPDDGTAQLALLGII